MNGKQTFITLMGAVLAIGLISTLLQLALPGLTHPWVVAALLLAALVVVSRWGWPLPATPASPVAVPANGPISPVTRRRGRS